MVAISQGESNCRADAVGDTDLIFSQNNREYGYSIGTLQIRILPGREWIEMGDYYEGAHSIWLSQGYAAWSCYTNGRYLEFLDGSSSVI